MLQKVFVLAGEHSLLLLGVVVSVMALIVVAAAVRYLKRVAFRRRVMGQIYSLVPELQQLRSQFEQPEFQGMQALDKIITFFDCISRWHDRDAELAALIANLTAINRNGRYDTLLHDLATVRLHFSNAGRDSCGWNRTEPGEVVTAEKIFLGNIWGLWTKPVNYWKKTAHDSRSPNSWSGGWHENESFLQGKNSFDVVSAQAEGFMNTHIQPLCKLIRSIQSATV